MLQPHADAGSLLLAGGHDRTPLLGSHCGSRDHNTPPGCGARLWWRYAIRCVQRQQTHQFIVWRSVKAVSALRKEYVPAYVRWLQASGGKAGGDDAINAMDVGLDEHVILLFR